MAVATKPRTTTKTLNGGPVDTANKAKLHALGILNGQTANGVHPYARQYARFLSGEVKQRPTPKQFGITTAKGAELRAEVKAVVPDTRKTAKPKTKRRKIVRTPQTVQRKRIADAPAATFSQADVALLSECLKTVIDVRRDALNEAVALGKKLGIA